MSGNFNCKTRKAKKQPYLHQAQDLAGTKRPKNWNIHCMLCKKQLELPSCPPWLQANTQLFLPNSGIRLLFGEGKGSALGDNRNI